VGGYGPGETILLREDVALVFFLKSYTCISHVRISKRDDGISCV
jgi:hypothetical protein